MSTAIGHAGSLPASKDRGHRALKYGVVAYFLSFIFGVFSMDTFAPVEAPKPIGAEKAAEDKRRAAAHFADGSLAQLFEYDRNQTSRFRRYVLPPYSAIVFRTFNRAKGSAILGADGWFFQRDRIVLNHADPERIIDVGVHNLAAVARRLAALKLKFVIAPVPRKVELYPQFLPHRFEAHSELYDELISKLRKRSVPTVDLLTIFRKDGGDDLFFRRDSHWTERAILLAAEEISRFSGHLIPVEDRLTEVLRVEDRPDPGDVLRMLGIDTGDAALIKVPPRAHPHYVTVKRGDVKQRELRAGFSATPNSPGIIITGTSFTDNTRFDRYLNHFTGLPVREAAWSGEGPIRSMKRAIDGITAAGVYPELLVWEIPTHYIFCSKPPLEGLGEVFAALPEAPTKTLEFTPNRDQKLEMFAARRPLVLGRHELKSGGLSTFVPTGRLIQPGDGSVALRFRGSVSPYPVTVTVRTDAGRVSARWTPEMKGMTLPILGPGPEHKLTVNVVGSNPECVLTLDAMDLVTDFDESKTNSAMIEKAVKVERNWSQTLRFAAPIEALDDTVLNLELRGRHSKTDTLELVFSDGTSGLEVHRFRIPDVTKDALIIWPLKSLVKKSFNTITVHGSGAVPNAGVVTAKVAVPPRAVLP